MLDIKFIRENKDLIFEASRKKRIKFDVGELLKIDDKRKELLGEVEKKRAEQNEVSGRLPQLKDDGQKAELIRQMKTLKDSLQKEEEDLKEVMKNWQTFMLSVPNIPDVSVPEGESDADNKEVKKWGEIPKFDFKPKDHIELMEKLDLADFEAGSRVSGFRGYFLKNEGAELEMALWQFVVDFYREYKIIIQARNK